jgi:ABC-type glycerol-3-phosphate transport system permease component
MRIRGARQDLLLDVVTVAAMLLMLAPIIWVFLGSFKPEPDIMSGKLWPTRVTIDHYVAIWNKEGFLKALGNSLIVGIVVAFVTTLLAAPVHISRA